jgi:transforming growth factor-beta-induced protein
MKHLFMAVIAASGIGAFGFGATSALATGTTDSLAVDDSRAASNIVQIAVSDPDLSTLVTALTDTGLVSTLEGRGPFTVFAPTNKAFAKLPVGLLDYLLANPAILKQVLLYHVASETGTLNGNPIKTVQGEKVFATFKFNPSGLTLEVNNSWVSVKPIKASNGVIYIIDSVLLPQFR